jgi:hypothetical protein
LERAINGLGTGDVLVLAEWDRCTRSMIDGFDIIERLHARGALIKVLDKPHLDLTSTGSASPFATWWMQVHSLLDWQIHLATLRGWKKEGRAPLY